MQKTPPKLVMSTFSHHTHVAKYWNLVVMCLKLLSLFDSLSTPLLPMTMVRVCLRKNLSEEALKL